MIRPRLTLRCRACNPVAGQLVETEAWHTRAHADYAAADHALDFHRDHLLRDADHMLSLVTVAA